MKNRHFKYGFALACAVAVGATAALTGAGPAQTRNVAQVADTTQAKAALRKTSHLMINQWYNLENSADVLPSEFVDANGDNDQTRVNQPLTLLAGTQVLVVDVNKEKQTATLAFNLEGQDDDEENPLPEQITVDLAELSTARPNLIEFEADRLGESAEDSIAADDADDAAADALTLSNLGVAKKNKNKSGKALRNKSTGSGKVIRVRSKGGMTMCLAEVRVNAKSICGQTMQTIPYAARGYGVYKAAGWKPVAGNKYGSMPVCTACFWGGGRTDCGKGIACGHASLKIGANSWIGAGIRPQPRLPDQNGCSKKGKRKVCRKPYIDHGCLVAPGH